MDSSAVLDRLREAFAASAYVALSVVLGTVSFVVAVVGVSVGFPLLIVALGAIRN